MIECLFCGRPRFVRGGCDLDPCEGRKRQRESDARFWPGPVVRTNAELAELRKERR